MENQLKLARCLSLLKTHLKDNNITYQNLADKLGISLLTIKRQLNAEDIALSKLLALCDASGVLFSELWQQVEQHKAMHTTYSKEQDEAFCRYPHLYQFFVEMFYNKKQPEQIERENSLSPASTHIYLRKLEQVGLISLSAKGAVSFLVSEPLGFGAGRDPNFLIYQNVY